MQQDQDGEVSHLRNNQLDIVLERVHRADEELQLDGDWPGRTVLRGGPLGSLCVFVPCCDANVKVTANQAVTENVQLFEWIWITKSRRTLEGL